MFKRNRWRLFTIRRACGCTTTEYETGTEIAPMHEIRHSLLETPCPRCEKDYNARERALNIAAYGEGGFVIPPRTIHGNT